MLLAVDVGNSNIVLGGYRGGARCFTARVATSRHMEADQYAIQLRALLQLHGVDGEPIDRVWITSVVPPLSQILFEALRFLTSAEPRLLRLADAEPCGVQVAIDNPRELGMDILASALAVRHTRPLPAVIVDMGTATKIIALDAAGRLTGVSISPGLFVSLDALVASASLLQGIPLVAPPAAIGKNTAASMQSGVILGAASMLDGMVDRFVNELGGVGAVVATGGAAPLVVPHCRRGIELCDTLLLDGLAEADRRA